jgi:hypothetical protein
MQCPRGGTLVAVLILPHIKDLGSSVSIVTRLLAKGLRFDYRQEQGTFYFHHSFHTGCGANLASYAIGTVGFLAGGKAAGA